MDAPDGWVVVSDYTRNGAPQIPLKWQSRRGETMGQAFERAKRERDALVEVVLSETETLRAEVERMQMVVSDAESEATFQHQRAEAAEAKVARVQALADEWDGYGHGVYNIHSDPECPACDLLSGLRAALTAPAEQETRP